MKALLFDLDNTLYPLEKNIFSLIDVRINRYMEEIVAIPTSQVDPLRRRHSGGSGLEASRRNPANSGDARDRLDWSEWRRFLPCSG